MAGASMSPIVKVFGTLAATDDVRLVLAAGVRKPPREETAGEGLERYGLRYGDLSAAGEVVGCTRGGRGER